MKTISTEWFDFMRRAWARRSSNLRFGESSMNSGASYRRPAASVILWKSEGLSRPERMRFESRRASAASNRCIRATADISRVKNPTGLRCCTAMWAAMVSASAVLPTEGRAPITTNSEF